MRDDPAGLQIALAHAALGREVFPFRLGARPGGGFAKVPLVRWQDEATTDEARLRAWWRRYPSAMPGWRLPPGTIVADVDDRAAFEAQGLELPGGPSQETPSGGRHVLYGHADPARQQVKAVPGLDTRVGGKGWVGLYTVSSFCDGPIQAAPAWLLGEARDEPRGEARGGAETYATRDDLLRFAGRMRRVALEPGQIEELMLGLLRDGRVVDLDPQRPWTEADMRQIARDIGRKPAGDVSDDAWQPPPVLVRDRDGTLRPLAELGEALFASASIGDQTAEDLPWGKPPPQMAPPFLTPEGATVLYGKGGVGKGMTACWLVQRLVRDGTAVMVLDFEFHPREWGSRLRRMGLTAGELRMVHYRSPSSDAWTAKGGDLARVWELVRADCDRLGVGYLVVDSYTTGSAGDSELGGQEAAKAFFGALSLLQRPSLVLAHVNGQAQRFPEKPFGSVFVHNLARETWAVEASEEQGDADAQRMPGDPDYTVELELRNMKQNTRGKARPQRLSFSVWDGDDARPGSIAVEHGTVGAGKQSVAQMMLDAIEDRGPLTAKQMAEAILDMWGERVDAASIRQALKRDGGARFTVVGKNGQQSVIGRCDA